MRHINPLIVLAAGFASVAIVAAITPKQTEGVSVNNQEVKNYVIPGAGRKYLPWFYEAENTYKIPRNLLVRIAQQESGFNPNAYNEKTGATGMMQIVLKWHPAMSEAAARDPYTAINYAGKYLREMYDKFHSWTLALAAYNWGPGNLQKQGIEKAPAETVAYIKNITADVAV